MTTAIIGDSKTAVRELGAFLAGDDSDGISIGGPVFMDGGNIVAPAFA
jgi:hypothetical protein